MYISEALESTYNDIPIAGIYGMSGFKKSGRWILGRVTRLGEFWLFGLFLSGYFRKNILVHN
jgi:hypothetical protein